MSISKPLQQTRGKVMTDKNIFDKDKLTEGAVDCIIINTTDIGVTPVNFLLACYNQISKDYMNNKMTIADALGAMQRCFQEALELEKQYKPHMPVNIHNGVSNILIHVKDGIIHVKPNPITKQNDSGGGAK